VLAAAGIFFLGLRQTGVRATATVGACTSGGETHRHRISCTATWVDGGSSVTGTIIGAGVPEVGKTVDVVLLGDVAFSRDLTLPLLLLGLSLVPVVGALLLVRSIDLRLRSG
jgi:hypothetical protein